MDESNGAPPGGLPGRVLGAESESDGAASARTAVDKALEVLAAFPCGDTAVGVSELARALGLTKFGAQRVHRARRGSLPSRPAAARSGFAGLPVGSRLPAHCSALGKPLLAHDAIRAEAVVTGGLRPRTRDTIVSDRRFRTELAAVRDGGIASGVREARPEPSCVATALLEEVGRPVAALSVGGPAGRFDARQHSDLLRRVAGDAAIALRRHRAGLRLQSTC